MRRLIRNDAGDVSHDVRIRLLLVAESVVFGGTAHLWPVYGHSVR
jgi:hypothetical protein